MDLGDDLSGPAFDGPNGRGRHPLPESSAFAATARRAGIRARELSSPTTRT